MWRGLARRAVALTPTLLLATFLVFGMLQLVPGDPAIVILGEHATNAQLAELRQRLGLNEPLLLQYWHWLARVAQGDLGTAVTTSVPVAVLLGERFPATVAIVAGAMTVSVVVGLLLGVAAALRANTAADTTITMVSTLGIAAPNFWLGMVLVSVFALSLRWLPATGYAEVFAQFPSSLRYLVLPSIALGAAGAAELTRQVRSAMIEVLQSEATRTLRAKGLRRHRIIVHALKNAGVPIATVIGLLVSRLLGGTVVAEAVFGIPGAGSLVIEAVFRRDYPVVQGVVLVMGLLVLLSNFLVDMAYHLVDPRIRA